MNVNAYAKINLGLHIVGKRQDGFHDIETIFHRISLYDEINIENSSDISISCTDLSIPTDAKNLCWKAVELLRNELGNKNGAVIDIKKNIPAGAGLGGGSSDAAAVLSVLPVLWNSSIEQSALRTIAVQLGSDIPFFLTESSAYAEGRGDILNKMDFTLPFWIVLVHPNIHLSTQWAYHRLAEKRDGNFPLRPSMKEQISTSHLDWILKSENDFEEIVFEKHPEIKKIKIQLNELGAKHSMMSGSGSSMYGLFDDMISALKAVQFFQKEHFVHLTEPYFTPQ
jgi:4-diphosphocytidyl-2-C-methyl-D-erythritol kinase